MYGLKSFGQKLVDSAAQLEASLAEGRHSPSVASPVPAKSPRSNPVPRISLEESNSPTREAPGSSSMSGTQSASQLAENAMANLRKSLSKGRMSADEGGSSRSPSRGPSVQEPIPTPAVIEPVEETTAVEVDAVAKDVETLKEIEQLPAEEISPTLSEPILAATPVLASPAPPIVGEESVDPVDDTPEAVEPTTKLQITIPEPTPTVEPPLAADTTPVPTAPPSSTPPQSLEPAIVLPLAKITPLPNSPTSSLSEPAPAAVPNGDSARSSSPTPSRNSVEVSSPVQPAVTRDPRMRELSKAFKQLQGLKTNLDRVVIELLSLSGISDVDAFEGELRNMKGKITMSMSEVGRLNGQLNQQKRRIEELRDTHRLESQSQTEQFDTLTTQLKQKDDALKLVNDQLTASESTNAASKSELATAAEEYEKLKIVAKEEEEKRVKALSLLRALRQKLVKSEKEKEDVDRERDSLRLLEATAQNQLAIDRSRFDQEIASLRSTQEQQITKLRSSFDRETSQLRFQFEREAATRKSQFELDAINVKATLSKELSTKDTRIEQLESTVREISVGRDSLFDQLQLRTAEVESIAENQEQLRSQAEELKYELKEAKDRSAALIEELDELRKARRDVSRDDANTRRLLAEAEVRSEARVRDLEAHTRQLENDRLETEKEMGANLQERLKEVERMRQQIVQKDIDYAESVQSRRLRDTKIQETELARTELEGKVRALEALLSDSKADLTKSARAEAGVREELQDRAQRASELEGRLEEVQSKESTLRSNNKILRDELRKLQSGVLLSEKQRNPGVGYFSSYSMSQPSTSTLNLSSPGGSDGSRTPPATRMGSMTAISESERKRQSTSTPVIQRADSVASDRAGPDEALNFEYLRNVLLEFLEKPAMRSQLLGVMGVILHFTPAELRRLAAKSM